MKRMVFIVCTLLTVTPLRSASATAADNMPPRIVVAANGHGFALALPSGKPGRHIFHPWGFNYGNKGRLIEDFWQTHWSTVAHDFKNMRALGANVVRVHLQFGKFMRGPHTPNATSLALLARLLKLAQTNHLYLDLTGLACYRPADTPAWYSALDDRRRWAAQQAFWRAVAHTCSHSHMVFCYDLVNEPLAPAGSRKPGQWRSGSNFGGYDFLQYIALHQGDISRPALAAQWIDRMTRAIRSQDKHTLITVGLLPWVRKWGWLSGFEPEVIAPHLSFISVHIYPSARHPEDAMTALRKCAVGKPIVIEETFPLSCSAQQEERFLLQSRKFACGWLGHYDGLTLSDYAKLQRQGKLTIPEAIYQSWQQLFVKLKPRFVRQK